MTDKPENPSKQEYSHREQIASDFRFRTLFEKSADAHLIIENEMFVDCNQAAVEMLRYESKEVFLATVHPATLSPPTQPDGRDSIEKAEEMMSIALEKGSHRFEWDHMRRDGEVFPAEVLLTTLVNEADQRVIYTVWRDITDSKRAQQALLTSETKFRNVIEQSNDAIYIVYESRFVLINKRFTEITGITEEDTSKADFNFLDSIAEESRPLILDRAEMWERGERPSSVYEFTLVNGDGERIQVQASVSQIDYEGEKGYLGILRDITEYKQLEEQLRQAQKMESIGRLAGGVAHDFNNILTVILGNLELAMLKLNPGDPLYKDLNEIEVAANRSTDLTRQLLGFARQQTVAPKTLDLNKIFTNMMNILKRLIGEDIDLVWKPGDSLWNVRIDPTQMDQILANMAVNARDAIDGVGKLTVETRNVSIDEDYRLKYPELTTGEYVLTTVSDNGSGMDKNVLENLFEPFFTTKGLGEGTGLGLATVFGIIKQNNGFIDVSSEPGRGTTFKIYLPRFKGETESEDRQKELRIANVGDETILIVEDEPSILKLGVKLLTGLGYKVYAANSPRQALQLSGGMISDTDLLITDVVMPEMNGKELAEELTEMNPELKVLFMSGYTADVIAHHGVLRDGLNFLQKPFSLIELSNNVRDILDS